MKGSVGHKIKIYLLEASKDAKVLRNINIDHIKKEVSPNTDEEIRDYFDRIRRLERDPEFQNPVFPKELVDWVESLPDNHFPRDGRKRFAKWLGNAIWHEEAEEKRHGGPEFENLNVYNNDVRYIADYLNGEDPREIPSNFWDSEFSEVMELALHWHQTLKGVEPTGDYETKNVVYKFENGYTIVKVPSEDLEVEGEFMGHCVGSYCDPVNRGTTEIYSLRNKKNEPHATIEVAVGRSYTLGDAEPSSVEQIKGKGNAAPVEKYRPMIKQWLQTTNFEYKESADYINIMSTEEIKEALFSGSLSRLSVLEIMRESEDQEILNYFLNKLEDPNLERHTKRDYLNNIFRNESLDINGRIKLLKINLPEKILGVRVKRVIGIHLPGRRRDWDATELIKGLWSEMGDTLQESLDDERVQYLSAIMESISTPDSIKEEILDFLLSDDFINGATAKGGSFVNDITLPYGSALQQYIHTKFPKPEQVRRLYRAQRIQAMSTLLGGVGRLNNYIASSRGMSDELAVEIIKDIKENKWWQMMQGRWIEIIINPRIRDSTRIQLLNVKTGDGYSIVDWTSVSQDGISWAISGRSFSRQLYRAADDEKFSDQFMKYMVDAGVMDPWFAERMAGEHSKRTGNSLNLKKLNGSGRSNALIAIRRAANDWLKGFQRDVFQENIRYKGENSMNELDKNIKIYLKSKFRPWGNIEDIDPDDAKVVEEWISQLKEGGISDFDKKGIEITDQI